MDDLSTHMTEEEQDDLPSLEKAIASSASEDSADMAKSFQRTKKFVPTRSHPSAPDKPVSIQKDTQ